MELQSFALLICNFALVLIGRLPTSDAVGLLAVTQSPIYATLGQTATITWRYTVARDEVLELLVCGYYNASNYRSKYMVQKVKGKPGEIVSDPLEFPLEFKGRVSVIENGSNFGMKIDSIKVNDEKTYFCHALVKHSGDLQVPVTSTGVKLLIRGPFIQPSVPSPIYAAKTKSVTLKWKYRVARADRFEALFCGIEKYLFRYTLLKKNRGKAGKLDATKFPSEYKGRVTVLENGSEFGMTIANIGTKDHKKKFYCILVYSSSNDIQVPLTSYVDLRIKA